jgi:hypothetical protein
LEPVALGTLETLKVVVTVEVDQIPLGSDTLPLVEAEVVIMDKLDFQGQDLQEVVRVAEDQMVLIITELHEEIQRQPQDKETQAV